MSLTVADAEAVVDLLCWLAGSPSYDGTLVREARAIDAMWHLATAATMALDPFPPAVAVTAHRIVERLRAADSDGAAQAVCQALHEHDRHGGRIPWPSVLKPFLEWEQLQDRELGERLRDQTAEVASS